MRREDRRMPEAEAWRMLEEARVCRLGFLAGGKPCVVPLSPVVVGHKLYFHSAPAGEKVEAIGDGADVCVEVDEILGRMLDCEGYRSVIARGWCHPVREPQLKNRVLDEVMTKFNPDYQATAASIAKVMVFEVEIREITGKAKR